MMISSQASSPHDSFTRFPCRYTGFGNISQDVPITVASLNGSPCSGSFCNSTAHIDITNLHFQTVRVAVGLSF